MAQGRVAHLIEWKGWCKPIDSPAALESDFNSYSDLTEGEQEARFAAGKTFVNCLCNLFIEWILEGGGTDSLRSKFDQKGSFLWGTGQLTTSTLRR